MSDTLKLQAYLAHCGIASRRKAEEMIEAGKVAVNGQRAHIGQRVNPAVDEIAVNGKKVDQTSEETYVLIYKPQGIISTTSDELNRRTVLSLVPDLKVRLYPVGRLDKDSEGLMLLTTDGALTHQLTHPSHRVPKTYHVFIQGIPTTKALEHLRRGVKLREGYTQLAEVEILGHEIGNTWLAITITEGLNRQVRRMLERVGYETLRLIRTQLGPFTLDHLGGEKTQVLSAAEVSELLSSKI